MIDNSYSSSFVYDFSLVLLYMHTHTHTHNHFTALRILFGTTWVSQHQKGKTTVLFCKFLEMAEWKIYSFSVIDNELLVLDV